MRYWLGPPEWDASDLAAPYYRAPAGVFGWIDLRSPAQCGVPASTAGLGLFVTANATSLSGYTNLGTDPQAILSGARRDGWRTAFGLPNALAAQTIEEALYETISVQADPTGLDRCLPLVPTVGRRYELWLAGQRVRNIAFGGDGAEAVPLRDMLKRQYRAVRQSCIDGQAPPLHYRKVLGYWVRKYRLAHRWFQPDDLPDESDLPPETTVNDDFNRANESPLAAPWVAVTGAHNLVSSGVPGVSTPSATRYDTPLSSDDMYAQIDGVAAAASGQAAFVRMPTSLRTGYFLWCQSTTNLQLYKEVASTITQLGSNTPFTYSAPDTFRSEANGSTITGYVNGVSFISQTDTGIAGNLRAGIRTYGTVVTIDNFQAADLVVAAGMVPYPLGRRSPLRKM